MSRALPIPALVLRYSGFALIAMAVNLGVQRLVLAVGAVAPLGFTAALAAGTLAGLVVKYLLDKRWIFYDQSAAHGRKFTLYAGMGLATTALFWGSETLFWVIWRSDVMRELGAVIGLVIGYGVKYRLDRRYVFNGGARCQR